MTATWFSAPAPVTRRVRAYFAPVNRAAQAPVLFDPSQQGGFQSRRAAGAWIDLGWIQDFARKAGKQVDSIVDGHSCRGSRAGARECAGAGEPAVLELDQADHGAGDGFATHECAGRGERRNARGGWSDGRAGSDAAERIDKYIHSAGVNRCSQIYGGIDRRGGRGLQPGRQVTLEVRLQALMCVRP